jgi:hypothetical protein
MNTITRKKTKKPQQLVIPQDYLDQVDGNKRKRISVVITDPRSRHLILTRSPEALPKVWFSTTIERGLDFVPSFVLQKAKIDANHSFSVQAVGGNLVIRRQ